MGQTYDHKTALLDVRELSAASGIDLSSEDADVLAEFATKIVSRETSHLLTGLKNAESQIEALDAGHQNRKRMHIEAQQENERLRALAQLGLKIIERGDASCQSDAEELGRFLREASQL